MEVGDIKPRSCFLADFKFWEQRAYAEQSADKVTLQKLVESYCEGSWGSSLLQLEANPPHILAGQKARPKQHKSTSVGTKNKIFVVKILWLRICELRGSAHVIQCLEIIQTPWTFSHFVTVRGILLGLYVRPTRSRMKLGSGSKMFETVADVHLPAGQWTCSSSSHHGLLAGQLRWTTVSW